MVTERSFWNVLLMVLACRLHRPERLPAAQFPDSVTSCTAEQAHGPDHVEIRDASNFAVLVDFDFA